MQYYPKEGFGFEYNEDMEKELNEAAKLSGEEYVSFEKQPEKLKQLLVEKFKMPTGQFGVDVDVTEFEYERGGYIQGLSGFEYGKKYVMIDGVTPKTKGMKTWIRKMETKYYINFQEGEWTQLM